MNKLNLDLVQSKHGFDLALTLTPNIYPNIYIYATLEAFAVGCVTLLLASIIFDRKLSLWHGNKRMSGKNEMIASHIFFGG